VLVIVRAICSTRVRRAPSILDWRLNADNDSMYNTPATILMVHRRSRFRWLKRQGGLPAMAIPNRESYRRLYGAIDATTSAI
jgi:phosphoserine aminotransferase